MTLRREVCFLIDRDGAVVWADVGHSPVALPDSRRRWEAIWARRETLAEVSHSHPVGPAAFSAEDESTMEALLTALGPGLRFSVVAPQAMVLRRTRAGQGEPKGQIEHEDRRLAADEEPWWAALLRAASGMEPRTEAGDDREARDSEAE